MLPVIIITPLRSPFRSILRDIGKLSLPFLHPLTISNTSDQALPLCYFSSPVYSSLRTTCTLAALIYIVDG